MEQGQEVFSSDGRSLGRIRAKSGDYVQVDASMAPDYWLHLGSLSVSGGRVEANFREDQLDAMKLADPTAMIPPDLNRDPAGNQPAAGGSS